MAQPSTFAATAALAPARKCRRPRIKRQPPDPETGRLCRLAEAAAAAAFAVPLRALRAPSRCRADIAFARQSAIYLAHVALGQNLAAVAAAFGRHRSTAMHACRRVEERRDDPVTDALFDTLEDLCRAQSASSSAPAVAGAQP